MSSSSLRMEGNDDVSKAIIEQASTLPKLL